MLGIGLVLIAASIGLAIWAVLSQAEEKATVRASLRQLEGYQVENVRDQELLKPVRERAVAPILAGLTGLGRRFTPVGYVDQVKRKHAALGMSGADTVDRFLAIRVVSVALIPVMFILFFFVLKPPGMLRVGGFLLVSVLLVLGPDATLNRKVEERKMSIRIALPDVLDLLVISVEAGLGFEQALDRTVASVPGALTEEFSRMLGEVRAGASRGDAMRNLEARCDVPELRSFVLAILQADTFGVSIGRVLRAQADEMRIKRRQLAQEQAQKAPVKMLIPMVFCIFPALFVVVLGPAIINISQNI
jgi:tight adherence protein C